MDMVVLQPSGPPGPPGLDPQAGSNAWAAALRVLTDSLATQKNHSAREFYRLSEEMFQDSQMGNDDGRKKNKLFCLSWVSQRDIDITPCPGRPPRPRRHWCGRHHAAAILWSFVGRQWNPQIQCIQYGS